MIPLYDAHRSFVLGANVLHADETPVNMLEPGASKTKRAYIWAYARSGFDVLPGVVYDFCVGRGAKYPVAFLQNWSGTLVCDEYTAYDIVFKLERRIEAGCLAHARRKFDELVKDNQSPVAAQAVQRIAKLYCIEREVRDLSVQQRLEVRQFRAKPLWEEMHVWLQLERQRVPDGSAIANAIDYSLNRWTALMANLVDGDVHIENHIENLMRPWAMGRKVWLFAGSELAGQRAAIVMSLVQSAKMHGHNPWAYLKDVLTRLPQLVQNDDVHAHQRQGNPTRLTLRFLLFQQVDQIDRGIEPHPLAPRGDARLRHGCGKVRFSRFRPTDEHHVLCRVAELQRGKPPDQVFIDLGRSKVKPGQVPVRGKPCCAHLIGGRAYRALS